MEGDFTRNSDDPRNQFSGVLMQQGRVQLDADWNEQWAIQTRALRTALSDLIGQHGGPAGKLGFALAQDEKDEGRNLTISTGPYYVDGIRCEAVGAQPISVDLESLDVGDGTYFAYLEVWDRHVSHVELPSLREPALLGIDTASRAQTVWRLKLQELDEKQKAELGEGNAPIPPQVAADFADKLLGQLRARRRPLLRAQAKFEEKREPCASSPDARYRGHENQLYRIEIHDAPMLEPEGNVAPQRARPVLRFKWSRENGSVVFPIEQTVGPRDNESPSTTTVKVRLAHLGRDARFGLVAGDVVEFVDQSVTTRRVDLIDKGALDRSRSGVLGTVRLVEPDARDVTIEVHGGESVRVADFSLGAFLRRWDQRARPNGKAEDKHVRRDLSEGAVAVFDEDLDEKWFELENGVAVQFARREPEEAAAQKLAPQARGGDYWTIPARVVTGDVMWPREKSGMPEIPVALPPHGVDRHLAPLAILTVDEDNVATKHDLRKSFAPLAVAVSK